MDRTNRAQSIASSACWAALFASTAGGVCAIAGIVASTAVLPVCVIAVSVSGAVGMLIQRTNLRTAQRELASLRATSARTETTARELLDDRTKMMQSMSHDLRTPLQALLGFSDVLRDGDANQSARIEASDAIARNTKRLLRTVDEIGEMATLAAGTSRAQVGNLRAGIQLALERASNDYASRGLRFEAVCTTPMPNASGTEIYIVCVAIEHALRHAGESARGSVVAVRCEADQSGGATITIEHDGQSAPAHVIALLQQHNDATRFIAQRPAGSGCLALALAKQRLHSVGGSMQIAQREHSTTIALSFRAQASKEAGTFDVIATSKPEHEMRINTSNVRVLVIDDATDTQRLVQHHLTRAGYRVESAATGDAGLRSALAARDSGHPFELLLLDMNLPDMDGTQIASTLRGEGYRGAIVAFTATATQDALDGCVKAGCDSWLTKPIDREKLLEAVRHAVVRDAHRRLAA